MIDQKASQQIPYSATSFRGSKLAAAYSATPERQYFDQAADQSNGVGAGAAVQIRCLLVLCSERSQN